MVDENRNINRLFEEQCNEEFANRYSAEDPEYNEFLKTPLGDPPIVERWRLNLEQRFKNRCNPYARRPPYQSRWKWSDGRCVCSHHRQGSIPGDQDELAGAWGGVDYRGPTANCYRCRNYGNETRKPILPAFEELQNITKSLRHDYGNFVAGSRD